MSDHVPSWGRDDDEPFKLPDNFEIVKKIFGEEEAKTGKIQLIEPSKVTTYVIADEISKILLQLPEITIESTITDATASIGGNCISFSRYFKTINAIEIDSKKCELLYNNLETCRSVAAGTNREMIGTVKIFCDDYFNIGLRIRQDIIFFDPPTKGKRLNFGDENLILDEFISTCLKISKYVVLKLPRNFDLSFVDLDPRLGICFRKDFKRESFELIIIKSMVTMVASSSRNMCGESEMESLLNKLVKVKEFQDLLKQTTLGLSSKRS